MSPADGRPEHTVQKSSLRVGIDVPWVTRWTAEPVLGVRPCPTVGGALAIVQQDNRSHAVPDVRPADPGR